MTLSADRRPPPTRPRLDDGAAADHVRAVVDRSGTSFSLGMRILPPERRHAMFAIYAFCREIDDVADDAGPTDGKLAALDEWRREIDRLYRRAPTRPTTRALLGPVTRFGLPRAEFLALIDGMEMDARGPIVAPDMEQLRLYCRRVAGAVGMLSIRAFGAGGPEAERFAVTLGEALQLTNILRDLDEDAELGRLYLPRELLERHGITLPTQPASVMRHDALPRVCGDLATEARRRFTEADQALARTDRRSLRPALLMLGIYEVVLGRLERSGWRTVRLSKAEKLWAALIHGWFRSAWRPSTS